MKVFHVYDVVFRMFTLLFRFQVEFLVVIENELRFCFK